MVHALRAHQCGLRLRLDASRCMGWKSAFRGRMLRVTGHLPSAVNQVDMLCGPFLGHQGRVGFAAHVLLHVCMWSGRTSCLFMQHVEAWRVCASLRGSC